MKEISVSELKRKMDNGDDFQLIDVREPFEYDICNLSGELIPLNRILTSMENISKEKMVVIHCRSGARSASVVAALESQYGFNNLYNLKGGILAYANEIDPSLETY